MLAQSQHQETLPLQNHAAINEKVPLISAMDPRSTLDGCQYNKTARVTRLALRSLRDQLAIF
jgi:hypothetical protein